MKLLIKDPRVQLSATLLLIFISSLFFYQTFNYLKILITAVGSTVVFDLLLLKLRKVEFFPPYAAITTGLIISSIFSPTLPLYQVLISAFLAMFSKNFIRGPFKLLLIKGANRHVFNPAGFGVLASSLIFSHSVSWWAVSFQPINSIFFLILLSPLLVSMLRLKRFMIAIPFLVIYFVLNRNTLLDPTVLFFSLVMLPEPQTTPNRKNIQLLFGIFVAVFAIISSKVLPTDPLIFALLTGNLIFYRLK